ncbi:chromatin assembly factor 1, p180 subunit [Anticarsia gemmatalis]|uniref:chromatin assembly factor 1, p180 subunit n=1 Tax=Anticarsia gemmatalis TaxID=129554 RepID=UPI003F759290
MKTSKSPVDTEVTPSKKKLKQARLPFKLLSDVSPKPDAPITRKRKLSAPEVESVTKVGKISKENDFVEEPVVISDDDSREQFSKSDDKESNKKDQETKLPNPFVKLVDNAWKKKLQKSKKQKKGKKKDSKAANSSCELSESDNKEPENESMDVDEPELNGSQTTENSDEPEPNKVLTGEEETSPQQKDVEKSTENPSKTDEVITLEESNNADDVIKTDKPNDTLTESSTEESADKDESVLDESQNESIIEESDKSSPSKTKGKSKKDENQSTPKRTLRTRNKVEPNNNSKGSPSTKLNDSVRSKSSPSSKFNDSVCSAPSTPKNSRSSSVTNSQGDVSLNESTASANLTPKQVQKKLESAKKKEEREKEKQEREKKRQQEKEERAKLKQEKEDQKKREKEEKEEAKRKEKEEKEEQRKKEKEEKEKAKELEKKQKEEKEEQKKKEREEKEEQKRKEKEAREEEKRKKQEALELEKQEQELKKKKAAEAFVNFFVPKQKSEKDQPTICSVSNSMLSNFTIKNDMRLAPLVRVNLSDDQKQKLDTYIEKQGENVLYLKSLKDGIAKPLSGGKTWPLSDKDDDDDVMIVEDAELPPMDGAGEILTCEPAPREKLRPKLLSFHENRRPPYWGTWRKKSASIKPRNPFGQDQKQLDYEVDSDEEWEEEQEGESIDGSAAGSDDEQDGDEYEVDNVVFVPHGYLSDEEATMDEDDVLSLSPETQQARLKHLEDEFASEMKKPTEKLKPRMYGLLWETADGGKPDKCVNDLWTYFTHKAMIMNDPTPLLQPQSEPEEREKKKVKKKKQATQPDGEPKQKSPKNEKKKKPKADDKETKTPKSETKKSVAETKKNQPGINMFLTKVKSS